jgi:hypothetical protein
VQTSVSKGDSGGLGNDQYLNFEIVSDIIKNKMAKTKFRSFRNLFFRNCSLQKWVA